MEISKTDQLVKVTYSNGKIKLYNADRTVGAVLEIESSELRKMYFGEEGRGVLHIQVREPDPEE